jgi:diguanylate cyclase (GGDEF)-like protein
MNDLLNTVAELTHLRDKDDLELSFARVVFQLAGASRLTIWRLRGTGAQARLLSRVMVPGKRRTVRDVPLDAVAAYRACVEGRRSVSGPVRGGARHVFPVCNDHREVSELLELVRPAPLGADEIQELERLVRVYGNHAGLLDYGARDELTGLLNRRNFNAYFKHVLAAARVEAVTAVIDIDFFKRINDEFGHLYGDEVLILMARLMERCFGDHDGLFRFGGEEFLVILTNTSLEQAWVVLEAFRNAVAAEVFPQISRVTVSIGFAAVRPGDNGAAAFGRADEALYVAKQRGRNQAQCHEWLVLEGSLIAEKKAGAVEMF